LIGAASQYAGLHFDEFLSRLRIEGRDWIDADDLQCLRWLQSAHGVARFSLGQARNGARSVAYSRRRDSLREFVEALPVWDGTPRIDAAFCDAWGAPDDALTRASSRNFFVAMIARLRLRVVGHPRVRGNCLRWQGTANTQSTVTRSGEESLSIHCRECGCA
jgi:hypothetical protein